MDNRSWGLLAGLGGFAAWLYYQQSSTPSTPPDSAVSFTNDPLASVSDVIVASTVGWRNAGDGPLWLNALNTAEVSHGIPVDLLARVAYQESHFRRDIIDGSKPSPAGALGLMQLEPEYFPSVRVAKPFTAQDTLNQIEDAALELVHLYSRFGTWSLALAAYNDGEGNTHAVISGYTDPKTGVARIFPVETQNYVTQVLTDIPSLG